MMPIAVTLSASGGDGASPGHQQAPAVEPTARTSAIPTEDPWRDHVQSLDVDGDSFVDVWFGVGVTTTADYRDIRNWTAYHDVVSYAVVDARRGTFLNADPGWYHVEGSLITTSIPHSIPVTRHQVMAYEWNEYNPGGRREWIPGYDKAPGSLTCILAFRIEQLDGPHLGWVRLRRGTAGPFSAFYPDGIGYNPFPGKPIRAGFPPELPPIRSVVTGDGRQIRLSWEAGYPDLLLMSAPDLGTDTSWEPVDRPAGNEATVPLPTGGQRFFRLVHVP